MEFKNLYQDCKFDVGGEMMHDEDHPMVPEQHQVRWVIGTIWYMIGYVVRVWSQPLRIRYCRRFGHDWVQDEEWAMDHAPGATNPISDCARCGLYHDDTYPF